MFISMNAPISRSSAVLLAVGAVVILLLGAFSRFDPAAAPAAAPSGLMADAAIDAAGGPELPAGLSPGLAEIFQMAQEHVDENVILAYIRNSGQTYLPTADEILYLSDLGLSQTVIAALFKQKPSVPSETAATTTASATASPTPVVSANPPSPDAPLAAQGAGAGSFYNALAPYGTWMQIPDYGLCWQPTTETLNPDWRPYVDQGQWLYTDNGWYWQSGYSWGWAVFHYGRWSKNGRFGWVWVPDQVWGPAWVSWRIALSYSGWAPLPPGVGLAAAGLTFNHQHVTADFDFGLPAGWFTFVSEGNFLNRNLASYAIPASQAAVIYTRSMSVNNYLIANQKVLNLGPGQPVIAAAAEAGTAPMPINKTPARKPAPAAGPTIAPKNGPQLLAAREDAAMALPGPGPDITALLLPQPLKVRRSHWAENYPADSSLAGSTRSTPLGHRDFVHRDQSVEPSPFAPPPQPDPARMMAASVPAGSKSGK
jgi:hypothetical protein